VDSHSRYNLNIVRGSEAFTAFTYVNYPLFNPNISPGIKPKAAATGKPAASIVVECAAN
jgi:hypothetical protein